LSGVEFDTLVEGVLARSGRTVLVFVMHSYPELIDVFLAFFSLNGGAECVHGDEYADYAVSILIYVNH
jgi:hypothetical protein